ncbi:IucA/IucC family C-terminal-domain containing protein [Pseudalkalibacillus sp. SCS-8]|uniref:IucA/IucC family C-terminal-domain containing protein n=1 Tax=Pseudalkalibacillus nanhaiensis TaxID=3115291 RepID=UPI0032DBB00B
MIYDVQMPNYIDFIQQNYRLAEKGSSDESFLSSEDLLDTYATEKFVNEQLKPLLNAPNGLVTASQFSKRYAFSVITPFFASLTLFDRVLNMNPDNCELHRDPDKGILLPRLSLKDETTDIVGSNREAEIHRALEAVFKGHIKKVWQTLNASASAPLPVLWENTAIYFYWLYETNFYNHELNVADDKIEQDFEIILNAPGECFGENDNPLAKFHHPKQTLLQSNPPVRVRKTCCLYYEVNQERNFCKTCPRCLSGYTE